MSRLPEATVSTPTLSSAIRDLPVIAFDSAVQIDREINPRFSLEDNNIEPLVPPSTRSFIIDPASAVGSGCGGRFF